MEAERRAMQPGNKKCGAMTRKKTPCADIAMANGRCQRHGGKSTGPKNPNTKAATKASTTHGIYSQFLTKEDRDLYDRAEIGAVDSELRLMRMRLARTVKARTEWEASLAVVDSGRAPGEDPSERHMVLVERHEDQAGGLEGSVLDLEKKAFRLPDYEGIEQRIIARIESLEKTRKELLKTGGDDPDPESAGRDHVTFTGGLDGDDEPLPSPFAKKPGK